MVNPSAMAVKARRGLQGNRRMRRKQTEAYMGRKQPPRRDPSEHLALTPKELHVARDVPATTVCVPRLGELSRSGPNVPELGAACVSEHYPQARRNLTRVTLDLRPGAGLEVAARTRAVWRRTEAQTCASLSARFASRSAGRWWMSVYGGTAAALIALSDRTVVQLPLRERSSGSDQRSCGADRSERRTAFVSPTTLRSARGSVL